MRKILTALPVPLLAVPLLAVVLLAGCSTRRAAAPASEPDTRAVLAIPLAQSLGAEEAQRIRAMAEVNGMLRHCGLRWEGYFGRMASQQRDLRRPEAEMQRIAIWHGYWLGATARAADHDAIACNREIQTDLRDRAEALLRDAPGR
ncbi:hypothetical protein [Roseococcus sp.]|uniref:hypothetical protein n=1 Tax=Roseococcus sp. TaxID=2109646 RepID=UPI003BAD8C2F